MRSTFESLIRQEVERPDAAIDELLAKGGLADEDISGVLRTGGSPEIPVFVDVLARRFGSDRVPAIDAFTTITGGLALKGHESDVG